MSGFNFAFSDNSWLRKGSKSMAGLLKLFKNLRHAKKTIPVQTEMAEQYFAQGNQYLQQYDLDAALESYAAAIQANPQHFGAHLHCGNVWLMRGGWQMAIDCFNQALQIQEHSSAYSNRGIAQQELRLWQDAQISYNAALALDPANAMAFSNRGIVSYMLWQYQAAVADQSRALEINPEFANAYCNRGDAWFALKQKELAVADYARSYELEPDNPWVLGNLLYTKMQLCDWKDFDKYLQALTRKIANNQPTVSPFAFLAMLDNPQLQLQVAQTWVAHKFITNQKLPSLPAFAIGKVDKAGEARKIRLAYFSGDFRDHPLAYVLAEFFELHDKSKFELIAFSYGPASQHTLRQRIEHACDQFIDVFYHSDLQVAEIARELQIDIAIDLAGHTHGSRSSILAHRVAPVQVSYMGYAGTMGAEHIDYLIADKVVIPPAARVFYSEKIVYLPDTYYTFDTTIKVPDIEFTRKDAGLPETGFVYCCFNNNHKILPEMLERWVRILSAVPDSVLWLFEDNPVVCNNLRQEAGRLGLLPQRLIFAPRMESEKHLLRYRLADLFLDTLPYNAHTTAADALWMGLPVLTLVGQSFAARVAASLLHALGLPELITIDADGYENEAIELANKPERLCAIKTKLANNIKTTALFDTVNFSKAMQTAFQQMYNRSGMAPEHIEINLPK